MSWEIWGLTASRQFIALTQENFPFQRRSRARKLVYLEARRATIVTSCFNFVKTRLHHHKLNSFRRWLMQVPSQILINTRSRKEGKLRWDEILCFRTIFTRKTWSWEKIVYMIDLKVFQAAGSQGFERSFVG